MVEVRKFISWRLVIIVVTIFLFILLNSAQETYIGLDQISESTLETINTRTNSSTPNPDTETSIPLPSDTNSSFIPPDQNPTQTFDFSNFLPVTVGVMILAVIGFLLLKRKNAVGSFTGSLPRPIVSSSNGRRSVFKTEILTLVDILKSYMSKGQYSQGIVYGFHQMDKNMKRLLGITRDSYLTPREFADSLDLPEILPYLSEVVNLFYLARYKLQTMKKENLESFIANLDIIQKKSTTGREVEIVETVQIEEENDNA